MQTKQTRFERQRRLQTIGLTIGVGLITAIIAALMIYLVYYSAHLRT